MLACRGKNAYKKGVGSVLQHQPDGHGALYALPHVTRFQQLLLRLRPVAAGRGPLFYLHPGGSPESQAKERQQRQDDKTFHGGQLLYPFGEYAPCQRMERPRNVEACTLLRERRQ